MAITKENGVTKRVKLDLSDLSREAKARAKNEAGRIIVEEIQNALDNNSTPVSGGFFSKAKVKSGRNEGQVSRLLDTGDLRSSIEVKNRRGSEIEVGVFKKSQSPIAYNHNIGDTVPKRQFIPEEDQDFKRKIKDRIKEVVDDIREFESFREEAAQEPGLGDLIVRAVEAGGTQQTVQTSSSTIFLSNILGDDFFD